MPLLIPYRCTHAVPVIRVVSERANAKEILLVLQEILERLSHAGEQEDEEEQGEEPEKLSPTLQLERVVFSYAYSKVFVINHLRFLTPRCHQSCPEYFPRQKRQESVFKGSSAILEHTSSPWCHIRNRQRVKPSSTP